MLRERDAEILRLISEHERFNAALVLNAGVVDSVKLIEELRKENESLRKMVDVAREFMLNITHTYECGVEEDKEPNVDECPACHADQELAELDRLERGG